VLRKLKIKLAAFAIIGIALAFFSQGTLAYFSTAETATNVVTSGNIRFIIHERTEQGIDFPEEGVYIIPGDVVSKEVSIESDCNHPFYLRVKLVYGVDSEMFSAADCFKVNIDETYWEYHDGWYYYKGIVNPGETTPNVFSRVEIVGSEVDSSYIGRTLTISVVAHAVQSENNPITDNNTYTASGWPKE